MIRQGSCGTGSPEAPAQPGGAWAVVKKPFLLEDQRVKPGAQRILRETVAA